jgi:hypothetical protein
VYASCGAQIQGMSVGWGDEYAAHLPGQEFDLSDLADGEYKVTIVADPENRIVETDETDNVSCIVVNISLASQTAIPSTKSCDGSTGGSVQVASITPNSASIGTTVSVTISGSGFVPGLSMTFDQGSGARPVASNVVVQNASTMTALVTVKKGKVAADAIWDLRIGSAVLPDAFIVVP